MSKLRLFSVMIIVFGIIIGISWIVLTAIPYGINHAGEKTTLAWKNPQLDQTAEPKQKHDWGDKNLLKMWKPWNIKKKPAAKK